MTQKSVRKSSKHSQKYLASPKLVPKTLRVASWNVHGGFYDSDKIIQVGSAFFRSKIDLLFLQEAQGTFHNLPSLIPDEGWCYWHNSYENEYSYGPNENPDHNPQDLCMIASAALNRNIIKISHPYPRIMVVQVRLPLQISVPKGFLHQKHNKFLRKRMLHQVPSDFVFVNVHVPTNPTTQIDADTTTEFYYHLQEVLHKNTSKHSFTIVLGDFNAKVGRDYPPTEP